MTIQTGDIDVTTACHISQDPRLLWAGTVFFAIFAAFMGFGVWMSLRVARFDWLLGLFIATFLFAVWAMWKLATMALQRDRVIVTLSPDGYRDTRVSAATIPWAHIRDIRTVHGRGSHLRLTVSDDAAHLIMRRGPRGLLQRINNLSLRPVLVTPTGMLRTTTSQLETTAIAYATAHGAPLTLR